MWLDACLFNMLSSDVAHMCGQQFQLRAVVEKEHLTKAKNMNKKWTETLSET